MTDKPLFSFGDGTGFMNSPQMREVIASSERMQADLYNLLDGAEPVEGRGLETLHLYYLL